MSGAAVWRLLDTGARSAAANIALDQAMLELRASGAIPDTIRFLGFSPAAALVGRHQTVAQEVREGYCQGQAIDINRRITGGGAVYIDATQICWEIIASRTSLRSLTGTSAHLGDLTRIICQAAAAGMSRLGISAAFRPRNDIEVNGRKLAGTGGAYEGDAFLFQGTLLVDLDLETIFRALRVPAEKLNAHELDAASERVVGLASLLPLLPGPAVVKDALTRGFAEAFGIQLEAGGLSAAEQQRLAELEPTYVSHHWIFEGEMEERAPADSHAPAAAGTPGGSLCLSSVIQAEGGLIRVLAKVDPRRRRISSALFSGDFFISPPRTVFDLEAALKDVRFGEARQVVMDFFDRHQPETLALGPADFWQALAACLEKCSYTDAGIPADQVDKISLVGSHDLQQVAAAASVLLLPYCAKLTDCDRRHADGCDECGECGVGEAFALAARYGLRPVTVQDYEQLVDILAARRAAGDTAFIGCCCQAFLAKRYRTFSASGLQGLIIDINDTTCYELQLEEEAYQGRFENQTSLRLDLLEAILRVGETERAKTPRKRLMV